MHEVLFYSPARVIQFTSGEYSDYSIDALVVTLKECDLPRLAKEYMEKGGYVYGERYFKPSCENFASWLIKEGCVIPVDVDEVHTGSYGQFEKEYGIKYEEGR